jgi:glycyl-tRNA synthetase beta chain
VLEARFNDARFFWEVDQHKPLAARVEDLKHVTFQAKIGSYFDKKESSQKLAREMGLASEPVLRALELAKCDLTAEMVKEFTDLQGVVGGLYARVQGEPEEVAQAIYEHYKPLNMEDSIPSTATGQVVSLIDKLDTLYGCFSIGLIPTGTKDPFALRRAAQGVVKILAEGGHSFLPPRHSGEFWEFFLDRVRYYFRDVKGYAYDEVNAVLAAPISSLADVADRLYALKLVRQTENFEPLARSFKRIRNILRQADWTGGELSESLLEEGPEKRLHEESVRVLAAVAGFRARADYIKALGAISTLRPAVDAFFDKVLVNAPDAAVRGNRLALLGRLFTEVSSIADFSEIVTASTSE